MSTPATQWDNQQKNHHLQVVRALTFQMGVAKQY